MKQRAISWWQYNQWVRRGFHWIQVVESIPQTRYRPWLRVVCCSYIQRFILLALCLFVSQEFTHVCILPWRSCSSSAVQTLFQFGVWEIQGSAAHVVLFMWCSVRSCHLDYHSSDVYWRFLSSSQSLCRLLKGVFPSARGWCEAPLPVYGSAGKKRNKGCRLLH